MPMLSGNSFALFRLGVRRATMHRIFATRRNYKYARRDRIIRGQPLGRSLSLSFFPNRDYTGMNQIKLN